MSFLSSLFSGPSGASVTPPPADCAALGTCDACGNLKYTDTGWCVASNERTLLRSNCVWMDAYTNLTCDTVPDPDNWKLQIHNGGDECLFDKPLTACPAGVYTLDDDNCGGYCADTITVYPV